ncbi:glycosyltransferase family 2 protein [Novosphingobium sp. ST904]|uniref:glycosyltransferase family 2 protein n=1 Tax=Novosphingobium sp. ST904 TaxID=1684385 RepID=UPI0006C83752|nr:glycosyltransferase family 2 protein [Novosphingobium sp. ST904]KPH59876.1 glycosyl transferase family 2 [Novosphingobium sp. ST904]TCM39853.1 dolichol-phosphate mannosyltransferase [Novosphingobium sp. ST904]
MSSEAKTLVSILVPAFNEELNVVRCYEAIVRTFEKLPEYQYEIIVTDNHSSDRTFELLEELARRDSALKVIRFSRNYGYQRSLLCAYKAAAGACSIQLDCDLQDPPELIPEMLKLWRVGHQVVYGIRRTLADGFMVATLRRAFYHFISWISDDDLPVNAGEFRLVDRRILVELQKVDDASPYLRGLISAMGFSQVGLEYDRGDRVAGESKFPLKSMISLAVDGVLNHSLMPLRIASISGIVIGVLSLLLTFTYLVGRVLLGQAWPAGFATTTILLLMSISINAIFMGILGEYVGRLFLQAKRGTKPIVEERLNFPEVISLVARERP